MAEIIVKERTADINQFDFVGEIASRRETKKSLTVTFRTTTKEGNRNYTNTMTILAFDSATKAKIGALPLRKKVRITGVIRSSKPEFDEYGRRLQPVSRRAFERKVERDSKKAEEEGKKQDLWNQPRYHTGQYFVATDCEEVLPNEQNKNEIYVIGSVESTFVSNNGVIRFTVRTNASDAKAVINMNLFPKEDVNYLHMMRQRAHLKIKAHCSTRGINTSMGTEYEETYLIDEIEKI